MNSGENQAKNREAAALLRRAANLLNTDSSTSINLGSSNSNSCDQADQGARQGVQQSPQLNTHQVQPQARLIQTPASSSSSSSVSNEEFRRLFAPYNRLTMEGCCPSHQQSAKELFMGARTVFQTTRDMDS